MSNLKPPQHFGNNAIDSTFYNLIDRMRIDYRIAANELISQLIHSGVAESSPFFQSDLL